jgi:hypothetical protein
MKVVSGLRLYGGIRYPNTTFFQNPLLLGLTNAQKKHRALLEKLERELQYWLYMKIRRKELKK